MADGVLLLAHGTADSVEEIPEYLLRVTGGRPLPEAAVEEVKHRFSAIGGSPLTPLTRSIFSRSPISPSETSIPPCAKSIAGASARRGRGSR